MLGTQGNEVDTQNHGILRSPLMLNAVELPYVPLIWTCLHYYERPTHIRFKDSEPGDSKSDLPRIRLTPKHRRLILAELNQPELLGSNEFRIDRAAS